ncbi:Putative alanine racemase, D-serine dehydratase-like domain, PLP-binding barrel [Colletotrichum destructivum]|uniref:D-serine dehydratase n=1 Tax=Colletotrichum destructivum TaxID=34406 RepID=A0AAX4IF32_9PEZI|nr:Putative alanine racemase, D-serine dehydratase-like domain, PLP-binding barrel [Colletotrichum destructivum]
MDYSLQNHRSFIGSKASDLPSPALILSLPVIKKNIERLHQDVEKAGVTLRPHVKTLKSLEVTRLMLGNGKFKKTVASTLSEIRGLLPLAKEGILDEVLYGLPPASGAIPFLSELRSSVRILLMIDHEKQISLLEDFAKKNPEAPTAPWDIYIKLDVGTKRAGLPLGSERLQKLIRRADESPAVSLYGFYCHAGHSYGCRTQEEAESVLADEINGVLSAAKLIVGGDRKLTLSVGATPTAHVVGSLKTAIPANVTLELHAGNFPTNDLQQVATGLVAAEDQAIRVLAEVCSVYPERNEALINAGTIALSKETGPSPGFGSVVGKPGWAVVRMSQEHGIVGEAEVTTAGAGSKNAGPERRDVEANFEVGDRVFLNVQHACITAAAFYVYYVVDEDDIVRDTWVPWKGW